MLDKYDNILGYFILTLSTSPQPLFDGVTNIVDQSISGIKITNMGGGALVGLGWDNSVSLVTPNYHDLVHPQSFPLQLDRIGVGVAKNLWVVAGSGTPQIMVSKLS